MSYLRSDITSSVQLWLGETLGTRGADDPFTLDRLITSETNKTARDTDCYFTNFTGNQTGTDEEPKWRFCWPDLYRIPTVIATLQGGTKRDLLQYTDREMDSRFPNWRIDPAAGDPLVWVAMGGKYSEIELYPRPDYTTTGGIVFYGWGVPGEIWPAQTDVFPLPDYAKEAVIYGVCAMRCIQRIDEPRAAGQLTIFQRMRDQECGRLEREVARQRSMGRAESVRLF